ncbi:MAG: hypothetical protein ACXABY_25630 [Candidatus Thorarchaeota archaeon]|jgi:hypothetical protein
MEYDPEDPYRQTTDQWNPKQRAIIHELYNKLAGVFGITLIKDHLTLRWSSKGKDLDLVTVQMHIQEVREPLVMKDVKRREQEMKALYKKYPNLEAELFHAEYGEWPQ